AQDTLRFTPGQQWDYCNVNFMLLTRVIENISGQSFADFASERLFLPLGMINTLINDDITTVIPNRVTPYNERTRENVALYNELGVAVGEAGDYIAHHRNAPHYGGSGVVTTVEDILKWSKNMVSQEFGGPEFYQQLHQTYPFAHDRNNQAFGLYFGDFNGRKIVAWDGGDWGISAQLMRFPDHGIAITVLSNRGDGEAFRKVNAIADILVDKGIIP
ncbi:MAG: serine hydrolase domain-containing protein, partial [Bacteroidota bacterium]